MAERDESEIIIPAGRIHLAADLTLPAHTEGLVMVAHGYGSMRRSASSIHLARRLNEHGLGTLSFDLLTPGEQELAASDELIFDLDRLAERVVDVGDWAVDHSIDGDLPLGCMGSSAGAAAILAAAAARPNLLRAIVSRGGRPDLAGPVLAQVQTPTLLIAGGRDPFGLQLNRRALRELPGPNVLTIVRGASPAFAEPGALDDAARLATAWFVEHLTTRSVTLSQPLFTGASDPSSVQAR